MNSQLPPVSETFITWLYGKGWYQLNKSLMYAGLLKPQLGGRSSWPSLKRSFHLLLEDIDDKDPSDIAYTYAGYAPLSIRIVEHAVRLGSGTQATTSSSKEAGLEETFKAIPGPAFDVLQTVDDHGLPIEQPVTAVGNKGKPSMQLRFIYVLLCCHGMAKE